MFTIEITEFAENEFIEAYQYYEEKQLGLGKKFENESDLIIDRLAQNPFHFQRKFKHYREALIKHFPYFIVFEIVNKTVYVHSFFHTSRNPKNKIKKRT